MPSTVLRFGSLPAACGLYPEGRKGGGGGVGSFVAKALVSAGHNVKSQKLAHTRLRNLNRACASKSKIGANYLVKG